MSSGMLGEDQVPLLILLGVNMTRQIHHIVSFLVLHFLRDPRPSGLPFELSLIQHCCLGRTCCLSLSLLLPTGISSSAVLGDWSVLTTPESVFLFAVSVLGGNLHHPSQGHISGTTELQIEHSVANSFLKGTYCLVI